MKIKSKIHRVMLVYPNQRWYKYDLTTTWNLSPYMLCLLAAMLQDKYEIKIVDAQFYNMSEEQFGKEVQDFKPDCVGISVLSSEYASILDTAAAIVKKINKDNLRLTTKGSMKCMKLLLGDKKEKWDGSWRILIFDIPEKRKIVREALRGKLKELKLEITLSLRCFFIS